MTRKNQKKCPYCATNHSKDLFNCSGSDYFFSVSIRQSKMYLMVFSYDGDYSEDLPINYCPICGRKLSERKSTQEVIEEWRKVIRGENHEKKEID